MNKSAFAFVGLGIAVLTILFVLFKPAADVAATQEPMQGPQAIVYAVRDGVRVAGPRVATVLQGTKVQVRVSADKDDELHVHGYDLEASLSADEPATLAFTADRAGRFAIELHKADIELGMLQVTPR